MSKPSRNTEIVEILVALEAELRQTKLWDAQPPTQQALDSSHPFCFDTLRFPQWLQWIFIPQVQRILAADQELPMASDIHPYAEEYFRQVDWDAQVILDLVRRFDRCINDMQVRRSLN